MKKRLLVGSLAAIILAAAPYALRAWRDIHPRYETTLHELKAGYSVELPVGWPKPDEEFGLVSIENSYDRREGSLDRFSFGFSIHDHGVQGEVEKIAAELLSGYDSATRVRNVTLANGVVAKTWTYWEPMGEISQEYRGYVFKGPNGHVYSVLEQMARDWRTKRRYGSIFRAVLGSMKFKKS